MKRRLLLSCLLFIAVFVPAAEAADAGVTSVGFVGMTVSDLDRSVAFYTGVLHLEKVGERADEGDAAERMYGVFGMKSRTARLRLGREFIELTQYLAPEGRPLPQDSRSNDGWFQHIAIIVSDLPAAYRHLGMHKVRHISPGPQTLPMWNVNAGGIQAFYFRDPDGHALELLQFPRGKGEARWQERDRLFLGIDHTAIVVSDTDRSLGFYRDTLGMKIAGESENFGPEQERLNGVFGAHLRITALRAPSGPGVELLEYLAPAGGRPYWPDAMPNDVLHWHTAFEGPDAESLALRLRKSQSRFISGDVRHVPPPKQPPLKSFLARDPDRHAALFIER